MLSANKPHRSRGLSVLLAGMLVISIISTAEPADKEPSQPLVSNADQSQRLLKVVESGPLIAAGVNLGTVIVYDDPITQRETDYMEIYDREGHLMAVSWFDRFGIQRVAVDRALIDGGEKLEGVFVAVVEDSFI